MANLRKFLFDNDFGAPASVQAPPPPPVDVVIEEEPPPPPPPVFGEEDLVRARDEGFALGRKAGIEETVAGSERKLADAVAAIAAGLERLLAGQAAAQAQAHDDSLTLALAVVRKLHPALARKGGVEEVRAIVEECLGHVAGDARVTARVNPDDLEGIRDGLGEMLDRHGFEGKLLFRADGALARGDCRIEWSEGGAERNQAQIMSEVEAVIARALGGMAAASAAGTAS